ncbi:MAG: hypothetical protein YHS30scaffold667_15 [Phage 65_10]|nr:MAG: hypothetical protein YHS30scaffold667_15 [Phage 65_10]
MTSVVTLPSGILFGPECGMGEVRYDGVDMADSTGSVQTRLYGHPRWTVTLASPQRMTNAEAARWRQLVLSMKGRLNVLTVGDVVQTAPRGTMRGTITLRSSCAAGDETLLLTGGSGQAARTLLAGDFIQVGTGYGSSQLVCVLADATADSSGNIDVSIAHPMRDAYTSSTAVTWDHPVGYFRQLGDKSTWTYNNTGVHQSGYSLDLLEQWT